MWKNHIKMCRLHFYSCNFQLCFFLLPFPCHVCQFNLFNMFKLHPRNDFYLFLAKKSNKKIHQNTIDSMQSKCDKWNGFICVKVVTKSLNLRFVAFHRERRPAPFVRWMLFGMYASVLSTDTHICFLDSTYIKFSRHFWFYAIFFLSCVLRTAIIYYFL